ncbi:MAG: redoxin domain-containing protein, partial [Deltaproteobacteria bacterium]|nr:redoxin domain-containing protein [Deltaproteobacteria bacterium]
MTLEELRGGRDATVLVFWSAGCPCVRRYQERVDALLDTYPKDRVQVVALVSNAGETLAEDLKTAVERGVRVPIYRDEGGRVARAVGARSTPTVVVLDKKGDVRFLGWLDNERLPGVEGREPWLDIALTGVLAGRNDFKK